MKLVPLTPQAVLALPVCSSLEGPANGIDILTAVCARVATESVLALLRNPEYAVYGASKVRKEAGLDAGEDVFNEVSLQERGKFKEETLVNVGGRSRSKRLSRCGLGFDSFLWVASSHRVSTTILPRFFHCQA